MHRPFPRIAKDGTREREAERKQRKRERSGGISGKENTQRNTTERKIGGKK